MTEIVVALGRAFAAFMHPRMLFLMVWPIAVALVLWTVLAVLFGGQVMAALEAYLSSYGFYATIASSPFWSSVATILSWVLAFFLFVPLVLITASLIIGIFSMPMMVNHVARRDYPKLERKHGGSFRGSVTNAFAAFGWLIVFAVVSAPLWLAPPLWPFIPIVLFGYFNQRLFRYDALAEHASEAEMDAILRAQSGKLWLLGIALAVIGHIPLVGFIMPVLGGLAFIYFLFDRLAALRMTTPVQTSVV